MTFIRDLGLRYLRIGRLILRRCWRWMVTDPNPNDPDRDSTGWN